MNLRRKHRLMVSKWHRATKWEFWPSWLMYAPLTPYLGYLAWKHGGTTVFTASNPGIVAGGVVGESKFAILRGLGGAGPFIARARLIAGRLAPDDKLRIARQFMKDHELTFPVVLKPDQGQRGSGVVIVKSPEALADALARSSVDTIVQEFADGPEFGVFYCRRPSEEHGRIFSITEKRLPVVVGDGRHTLEHLILHDERAVCAAEVYLARYRERLTWVPAAGVPVRLAELGTHCRGAVFCDGQRLLTAALQDRIDTIARTFDGFYFGRFDIRATEGVDAFARGEGFKVIELNGVTSEATHIYHPGTPLLSAYRVLMEQWRLAFEIGAENRQRGFSPASIADLIHLARDYAKVSRAHLPEHI